MRRSTPGSRPQPGDRHRERLACGERAPAARIELDPDGAGIAGTHVHDAAADGDPAAQPDRHAAAADGAPGAAADLHAWDAEWARARGDATADQWADVAAEYRAVTRPHLEAYCRWRQADVLLAHRDQKRQAADVLHDAARLATGHAPLLGAINDLATRARIDLTLQTSSPAVPAAPYGLTPRELTVLRLLSQGRSNGQIGAELFISTKTASVHVSNILRKMQVPSRVAAASLASQIDLFEGRSGERSASEA